MMRFTLLRVATLPFEVLGTLGAGDAAVPAEAAIASSRAVDREAAELADRLFIAAGPPAEDTAHLRARFALLRVRRDVHARRLPHADDRQEAAPLLDAELASRLEGYERALATNASAQAAFESAWGSAAIAARRGLLAIVAEPLVEHGMYLASRSLVPKVRKLASREASTWRHADRHTAAKATAYVDRFASKTSPNGVFCAVAPAWLGGSEAAVSGLGGVARTDVLLSLAEVRKVAACLAADPAVAAAVVPRPNPTLREHDGGWTYWKPASPRNATDEEVHARVKDHPVLRAFVEETAPDRTTDALVDAVASRTGFADDDLRPFLARLIEQGILIGELEVPWSSRRRFRDLAAAARPCAAPWIVTLGCTERAVDDLAALPFDLRPAAMDAIARQVEPLPRQRPFRADELFRVDSASALEVRVPERVHEDLSRAMSVFARILAALYPETAQHRRFVQRFLGHHPPDTNVPFLDVYGTLAEPQGGSEAAAPPMEFPEPPENAAEARRIFDWFVRRAADSAPGDEIEVDLDSGSVEPRWCAGVLFQIAARSPADLGRGDYRIALNGVFNGIGLALSRFAHLLQCGASEGPIVDELRRAWSAMERPGAVLAELTFNHEARTANAGLRPVLFPREIELPGDRVSPGVENVPLSDLVLRYDHAADRLVLRSRSSGLEILPVVSSGVSPSGIVSALIHLGRQGMQSVGYLPGFRAPDLVRWPRFVCGRVVLFRARWVFRSEALPPGVREWGATTDATFFLELARWRDDRGLPRHVFVHTSLETKPFHVDFESPLLVDLLRRALAGVSSTAGACLVVTEMLPSPDDLWVRDPSGSYASEFLVQMEGPTGADRVASS